MRQELQEFVLPPRGLETNDTSTLPANELQQTPQLGAAQSGAVSFDAIIAMLAALSPEDRARLAALLATEAPNAAPDTPKAS